MVMYLLRRIPCFWAACARPLLPNISAMHHIPRKLLILRSLPANPHLRALHSGWRRYASQSSSGVAEAVPEVGYEEVCRSLADPTHLLIDVREPNELAEGNIPSAINIPLGEVRAALAEASPRDFEARYGRPAPEPHTPITFYCQVGKRSHAAATLARQLGYHNSKNYLGSYSEWADKKKNLK